MALIRNKTVPDTEYSGTIFKARSEIGETATRRRGGRRRSVDRRGTEISLSLRSEDHWAYLVRADILLERVFDRLLIKHREAIRAGKKADGSGQQPALTKRVARRTRQSPHRGFQTGYFADTIKRTKLTGSTGTARTRMVADSKRNVFVAMEASRGIEYFYVEGDMEREIHEALEEVWSEMIEGRVGPTPKHTGTLLSSRAT